MIDLKNSNEIREENQNNELQEISEQENSVRWYKKKFYIKKRYKKFFIVIGIFILFSALYGVLKYDYDKDLGYGYHVGISLTEGRYVYKKIIIDVCDGGCPEEKRIKIKDAHIRTFEALTRYYTKDKNNVYYYYEIPVVYVVTILDDADPETFEVIYKAGKYEIGKKDYAKDKNNVYRGEGIIKGADPRTFEFLGSYYSKDKYNVFYISKRIEGADPETFEYLPLDAPTPQKYFKDKNNVYYRGEIIKEADPKTFELYKEAEIPPADETGWQTYRNEEYGFEVKYPKEVIEKENSVVFTGLVDDALGIVRIIFKKDTSSDGLVSEIEQGIISDKAGIIQSDEIVSLGNISARKITYGLPIGRDEYIYYIERGNDIIEISWGYYEKEDKKDIEKILSSFNFID